MRVAVFVFALFLFIGIVSGEPLMSAGEIASVKSAGVSVNPVIGDVSAPVLIVEYGDYQCPFCAKFWMETFPLIEENYIKSGKVKFEYRDFPLENSHEYAYGAAAIAECVRQAAGEEKFWDFHDKIFSNNGNLDDAIIWETFDSLGLSQGEIDGVDGCLESEDYVFNVDGDMMKGIVDGVYGTPSFLINGRLVSGAQSYKVFEQVIEEELESGEEDNSLLEKIEEIENKLDDFIGETREFIEGLAESDEEIFERLDEQEERISELESKNGTVIGGDVMKYLKHLGSTDRKNIVCGLGTDSHSELISIPELGYKCDIIYRQTSRGEKATCKCSKI